jgi:hypothetical protein
MTTEWRVEGSKSTTKIVANCTQPACRSSLLFSGSIEAARRLQFQHNLCNSLIEKIPLQIWQEYRDKKFDPGKSSN